MPFFVRLIDQNPRLFGCCLLDLDARDATLRPVVDLPTNLRFCYVVGPAYAIIFGGLDLVFASEGAEIWARVENPGSNGLATIDTISGLNRALGEKFAGGPGRGYTVGEEQDRVVVHLFGPALVYQIHVVVGV